MNVAGTYAQALFEVGVDDRSVTALAELLRDQSALRTALINPLVTDDEKHAGLEALLPEGTDERLLTLASLLWRAGRLSLLEAIARRLHALCLAAGDIAEGELACARPMSDDNVARIERTLERRLDRKAVRLSMVQRPELLGGFKVTADGVTWDASVAGMADALRVRLVR